MKVGFFKNALFFGWQKTVMPCYIYGCAVALKVNIMKKCKKCGNSMSEESRFCTNCGYDSRGDSGKGSETASENGDSVFSRINKNGSHSSGNHNCRAERVNGQEVKQKKSASSKKLSNIIVIFLILAAAVPVGVAMIAAAYNAVDSIPSLSYDFPEKDNSYYDDDFYSVDYLIEPGEFRSYYVNPSVGLRIDYSEMGWNSYAAQDIAERMGAEYDASANKAFKQSVNGETVIYDAYFESEYSGESIIVSVINGDFSNVDLEDYANAAASRATDEMDGLRVEIGETYNIYICGEYYIAVDVTAYPDKFSSYAGEKVNTLCFLKGENSIYSIAFTLNEPENDAYDIVDNYFYW